MSEENLIEEAVSLINRGERLEALKVFRRIHGIINGFQCEECKVITSGTLGFKCLYCGGDVDTVVFHDKSMEEDND